VSDVDDKADAEERDYRHDCAMEALALEHRAEVRHWQDEVFRLRKVINGAIRIMATPLDEAGQTALRKYLWYNKTPPEETKEPV
jgi:hypothetical protein